MEERDILLKEALSEMEKESPDLKVAYQLLEKSAQLENAEALYAIGTWYLFGRFVDKDPSKAVEYFLEAIKGNNSSAYYDLGVCYEEGTGVDQDEEAAFECYLNAALLGDKQSLYE